MGAGQASLPMNSFRAFPHGLPTWDNLGFLIAWQHRAPAWVFQQLWWQMLHLLTYTQKSLSITSAFYWLQLRHKICNKRGIRLPFWWRKSKFPQEHMNGEICLWPSLKIQSATAALARLWLGAGASILIWTFNRPRLSWCHAANLFLWLQIMSLFQAPKDLHLSFQKCFIFKK